MSKRSRSTHHGLIRVLLALSVVAGVTVAGLSIASVASAQTPGWSNGTSTSLDNSSSSWQQMISCPFDNYCVAVDDTGSYAIYNGSSWSSSINIDASGLTSVSCPPGTSTCVATDASGNALVFDGTTWSSVTPVSTTELTAVSCPTVSFCVAVDNVGGAYTYDGSNWSSADQIDPAPDTPRGILISVSCPSPTFCVAVDKGASGPEGGGYAFTDNSGTWTTSAEIDAIGLSSVSCASSTFCVALNHGNPGTAYISTDGFATWTGSPVPAIRYGQGVSCPSASFCLAIDETGDAVTYDGSVWSSPTQIDPLADSDNFPFEVTCSSPAFCVTQDLYNFAYVYAPIPVVTILPSPVPASLGPVNYVVTVTGNNVLGAPTGTVTVTDGTTICSTVTLTTGANNASTASCSMSESAPSSFTVTASYNIGGNYNPASASLPVSAAAGVGASISGYPGVTTAGGTASDAVTASVYSFDPVGALTDGNGYFDTGVTQPTGYTSVTIEDCGADISTTTQMSWWDPSANGGNGGWVAVVGAPGPTVILGSPNCITVTLDNTTPTSPDLAELNGSVFGLAHGLQIASESLPEALVRQHYAATLEATGGNSPYSWSIASGHLPSGLKLHKSTGLISGRAKRSGTSSFTVKLVDHRTGSPPRQNSVSQPMSITITQPRPRVSAVHPASGPVAGHTSVTVNGTFLEGASSVMFGGVAGSSVHVNKTGTKVTVFSPAAGMPGTVDVTVTTPGGASVTGSADGFTYS